MLKSVIAMLGFASAALLLVSFGICGYHALHWLKYGTVGDVVTTRMVLSLVFGAAVSPRTAWVGLQQITDVVLDAAAGYASLALGLIAAWLSIALLQRDLARGTVQLRHWREW
jgi:hypothetical protein